MYGLNEWMNEWTPRIFIRENKFAAGQIFLKKKLKESVNPSSFLLVGVEKRTERESNYEMKRKRKRKI